MGLGKKDKIVLSPGTERIHYENKVPIYIYIHKYVYRFIEAIAIASAMAYGWMKLITSAHACRDSSFVYKYVVLLLLAIASSSCISALYLCRLN